MTKPQRKRLSLLISFLLMAFVFCQGVAQAAVIAATLPQPMKSDMASCHENSGSVGQEMPACSSCQHLDKASDSSGHLLLALDHVPVLIAFLLLPVDEPTSLKLAASSPPDPTSDPPLTIRFQRFRE